MEFSTSSRKTRLIEIVMQKLFNSQREMPLCLRHQVQHRDHGRARLFRREHRGGERGKRIQIE